MTTQALEHEIQRFLGSDEPEVLCITGKWGVGKTFAWQSYLERAQASQGIKLENYAYVSLFGLGGLEDLRKAIFDNTVPSAQAARGADLSTLEGKVQSAKANWRLGAGVIRLAPVVADYAAFADKLGFLTIRKQIICIDDLERRGSSLDLSDVLGLTSFLKDQRKCKLVLLLNDEQFVGDDGDAFKKTIEKVADTILRFEPTPIEASKIGVSKGAKYSDWLAKNCQTLGIVNIRTIKKLERFAFRLEEILNAYDPRVLKQSIHTACLYGYAKFQPGIAPSVEFVKEFNPYHGLMRRDGEADPHPAWRALLHEYDFTNADELDLAVITGIDAGFFDPSVIKAEADRKAAQLLLEDQDSSFSAAWKLYHGSFDNNADEVVEALASSLRSCTKAVSPVNLSSTISLLKELGRSDMVDSLIQHYVEVRSDEQSAFWNRDYMGFGDHVTDPDVVRAFEDKLASYDDERNFGELLAELGLERGWNGSDVAFLARFDAEAYYDLFKRLRDPERRRAVTGGLLFRSIATADEDMKKVTRATISALKRIASESSINRRRVAQLGISLDSHDPWEPPIVDQGDA